LLTSLGSKQRFTDWFDNRKDECDLIEDQDFGVNHKIMKNPQGGRPTVDYWLTLDAAKEMAMLERNEAGKRIRRYLIDVEKKFRALRLQPDLSDPQVLLRYLHDTSGKLIASQERVAALADHNELLQLGLRLESENARGRNSGPRRQTRRSRSWRPKSTLRARGRS
jgi:phage anti-repressor protein